MADKRFDFEDVAFFSHDDRVSVIEVHFTAA
jgi:hypothetical protein